MVRFQVLILPILKLRHAEMFMDGITASDTLFVDRNTPNLNVLIVAVGFVHDTSNRFLTSLLRCFALTHQFNNKKTSNSLNNFFPQSSGNTGTYFIIHKQSRTTDWTVANTSMHFIGQSTGGTSPCNIGVFINSDHPNGIMVFNIDDGLVRGRFLP